MEFSEEIKLLSQRVTKYIENTTTEEATKNLSVLPFIRALGYDVFNPTEVYPEYVADFGTKKGEKVDYCIFNNNQPLIIIECKH